MIPYLCPDLPERAEGSVTVAVKTPLVYTSVGVRNWRPFVELWACQRVYAPGSYFIVDRAERGRGDRRLRNFEDPDQATLLRLTRMPCAPGRTEREQNRAGRMSCWARRSRRSNGSARQLARVLGWHRLRSGAGHYRNHGEPLAAWLCARVQPVVRRRAVRGRTAPRRRPRPLRRDCNREFRRGGRGLCRCRDRPGPSRSRGAAAGLSSSATVRRRVSAWASRTSASCGRFRRWPRISPCPCRPGRTSAARSTRLPAIRSCPSGWR